MKQLVSQVLARKSYQSLPISRQLHCWYATFFSGFEVAWNLSYFVWQPLMCSVVAYQKRFNWEPSRKSVRYEPSCLPQAPTEGRRFCHSVAAIQDQLLSTLEAQFGIFRGLLRRPTIARIVCLITARTLPQQRAAIASYDRSRCSGHVCRLSFSSMTSLMKHVAEPSKCALHIATSTNVGFSNGKIIQCDQNEEFWSSEKSWSDCSRDKRGKWYEAPEVLTIKLIKLEALA